MAVMKSLENPETIETKEGIKRATHEAFCYAITPFSNPPIRVQAYKGFIDGKGKFRPISGTETKIEITPEEFRILLNPNPLGKRAGDFRLSDIQVILDHREKNKRSQ